MNFSVLVLSWWLAAGWMPVGSLAEYRPQYVPDMGASLYTELAARVRWGPLFVEGKMRVNEWVVTYPNADPLRPFEFWPNQLESRVGFGVVLGLLEVGVTYDCAHPVMPWAPWGALVVPSSQDSAYSEIYVRLSGSQEVRLAR